jgi:chlorite dismutase
MRYDKASAVYAEFGPFYTGVIGEPDEVVAQVGLG